MSSLAAATRPALNSRESPGRKKPKSNPVSTKIILLHKIKREQLGIVDHQMRRQS